MDWINTLRIYDPIRRKGHAMTSKCGDMVGIHFANLSIGLDFFTLLFLFSFATPTSSLPLPFTPLTSEKPTAPVWAS